MRPRTFEELIAAGLSRRDLVRGGLAAAGVCLLPGLPGCAGGPRRAPDTPRLGFAGIAPARIGDDHVRVPEGYEARTFFRWGDPLDGGLHDEAASLAALTPFEQAARAGMHHDGMHFFPLREPDGRPSSTRGLLAVNHEYTDDGLLHVGGLAGWSAEKVAKSQAAHGVSIVEVELDPAGRWSVVQASRYARRISGGWMPAAGAFDLRFDGPAAGSPLLTERVLSPAALEQAGEPVAGGRRVLGTLGNCAGGPTPWDTFLTCEENFADYFVAPDAQDLVLRDVEHYGIDRVRRYRWHEHDPRFAVGARDGRDTSHEPHRYGWVVEIDPHDPACIPVKHTALGRLKHEGATVRHAPDGHVVVYMGDDEKFECIYKFVSAEPWDAARLAGDWRGRPDGGPLARGTLYAARFDAEDDGAGRRRGTWLPLTVAALRGRKRGPEGPRFEDEADILVFTREAAHLAGATPMDRPEWIAIHPHTGEVCVSLTKNDERADAGPRGVDPANPRPHNVFGHLLRWREDGDDPTALGFAWEVFLLGGEADAEAGSASFACPDGLWFDARGVLWVQTDVASVDLYPKGPGPLAFADWLAFAGHNQMLAIDPTTREVRRFLTGPRGCEVTGITTTPDGQTLFVNIQHPGEPLNKDDQSGPDDPPRSSWPDSPGAPPSLLRPPRSAVVAIRRIGGGVIGA